MIIASNEQVFLCDALFPSFERPNSCVGIFHKFFIVTRNWEWKAFIVWQSNYLLW